MKQILSLALALLPCLAWAQYPSNGNQKITLGEQTTADGLIWRGVASIDTVTATSKITRANKQDTSAFLLLDTVTNLLWHYKTASNGWIQAGGGVSVSSFSAGTTGLTPSTATTGAVTLGGTLAVANGGTGATTLSPNNYLIRTNSSGVFDTAAIFEAGGNVGIGTASPSQKLSVVGNIGFNSLEYSDNVSGIKSVGNFKNSNANGNTYFSFINDLDDVGSLGIIGSTGNVTNVRNRTIYFFTSSPGGLSYFVNNNAPISFATNGLSTKMIIDGSGNVGIGTTSPLALLNVMGTVRINSASAPDANYYLQLENSSSQKAKANAWDTYSDKRIKTDIQPIFNAIDKVNLLNPVYYQKHDSYVENDFLNIDYESSVKSLGFIAQEVYNVIPEAVNTGTTNELWAMDYTKIIPILTKAIQEQNALIKALEQRIINLENK